MIRQHWAWFALAALLLLAWGAYSPGLGGSFLFDDFVNLDALNNPGPVDDWPTFWRYITSGTADPLGRPLSLLTFLIDAREWPADPAPFLRTNLCIHLANGALLFLLLRNLGRRLGDNDARNDAAALLGAGMWLLHPLFVSTTLYVVQREAMLPATATLLGLLAYVRGRTLMDVGRERAGIAWIVGGIVGGTAVAMSCKANGLLLPLFAWVLEATVLRATPAAGAPRVRLLRIVLLVIPSVLLFAYLLSQLRFLHEPLVNRTWSLAERLLTEPRVLVDYLKLLAIPRVLSTGLFNDGYVASKSLLSPPSTLLAMVAIAALLAVGFATRKRAPALSAALLFLFAGHVLESTTIALELYFEHRNYLPAMLLFWPLARVVFRRVPSPIASGAIAVALLALLAAITWQRAALWGQPQQMASLWALQNPASSRAQATAASFDIAAGRPDLALARLGPMWRRRPHDLQLALNHANAACALRGLQPAEIDAIAEALRHAEEGHLLLARWLERAMRIAAKGGCRGLTLDVVDRWVAAAGANPIMQEPGRQQDLHTLLGRMALQRARPDAALRHFDLALDAWPTPDAAAMQAALLATHRHYAQALAHLDHYERIGRQQDPPRGWNMQGVHAIVLERQGYWPYELGLLRRKLQAEIDAAHRARD